MNIHRSVFTACCALAAVLAGCQTTSIDDLSGNEVAAAEMQTDDASLEQAINESQVTMTVYGMGCPLCATNVDKQLNRVQGVESVDIDLNTGRINVGVNPRNPPTRGQLKNAVVDSGFTFINFVEPAKE